MIRRHHVILLGAVAVAVAACGGGAATLHPAHVLPEGRVSAGAGVSSTFQLGEGKTAVDALNAAPTGSPAEEEQRTVDGVLATALFAPGLAPWVGARAGLGGHNEAGATYTGRSIRLDARHAFSDEHFALSVGAGASGILMHPRSNPPEAAASTDVGGRFTEDAKDASATGFGFDVPVIVGYRSAPSIAQVWAGGRVGLERVRADLPLDSSVPTDQPARASGTRVYGGGLVGLSVGVKPVWISLQLDVNYQSISGNVSFPGAAAQPASRDASFQGLSLVPTGAVIGNF